MGDLSVQAEAFRSRRCAEGDYPMGDIPGIRHRRVDGRNSATTVHVSHSAITHGNAYQERRTTALSITGRCEHAGKPNRTRLDEGEPKLGPPNVSAADRKSVV